MNLFNQISAALIKGILGLISCHLSLIRYTNFVVRDLKLEAFSFIYQKCSVKSGVMVSSTN